MGFTFWPTVHILYTVCCVTAVSTIPMTMSATPSGQQGDSAPFVVPYYTKVVAGTAAEQPQRSPGYETINPTIQSPSLPQPTVDGGGYLKPVEVDNHGYLELVEASDNHGYLEPVEVVQPQRAPDGYQKIDPDKPSPAHVYTHIKRKKPQPTVDDRGYLKPVEVSDNPGYLEPVEVVQPQRAPDGYQKIDPDKPSPVHVYTHINPNQPQPTVDDRGYLKPVDLDNHGYLEPVEVEKPQRAPDGYQKIDPNKPSPAHVYTGIRPNQPQPTVVDDRGYLKPVEIDNHGYLEPVEVEPRQRAPDGYQKIDPNKPSPPHVYTGIRPNQPQATVDDRGYLKPVEIDNHGYLEPVEGGQRQRSPRGYQALDPAQSSPAHVYTGIKPSQRQANVDDRGYLKPVEVDNHGYLEPVKAEPRQRAPDGYQRLNSTVPAPVHAYTGLKPTQPQGRVDSHGYLELI